MKSQYVLFLFLLVSIGCNSQKKLAQKCADNFPCIASTKTDTIVFVRDSIHIDTFKLGESIVYIRDTVECPKSDTVVTIIKTVQAKCPESQIIEKVRFVETTKTVTVEVTDSSQAFLYKMQLNSLNSEITKLKSKKPFWLGFGLGALSLLLLLIAVLYFALKFTKKK